MSLSKSLLGIFLTLMAVLLGIGTGMIVKQVGDDVSITTLEPDDGAQQGRRGVDQDGDEDGCAARDQL